eukprot:31314-Pelagococcus_subviridis.AAC.25
MPSYSWTLSPSATSRRTLALVTSVTMTSPPSEGVNSTRTTDARATRAADRDRDEGVARAG